MTAAEARLHLLAQHARLREQLQLCARLATLYRAGAHTGAELDAALEVLRDDFASHNATETSVIRELLHGPTPWSSLMIDRMLEEHVAEHAAFWELMSGTRDELALRIDDLGEVLDAHMAAEERTFLAPATLRDDVIRVRARAAAE